MRYLKLFENFKPNFGRSFFEKAFQTATIIEIYCEIPVYGGEGEEGVSANVYYANPKDPESIQDKFIVAADKDGNELEVRYNDIASVELDGVKMKGKPV